MKIKLNRPICFFDLETTGGNVGKDRIVEIAILRVDVDKKESKRVWRVNPEMEISFQAIEVHGITNEMIENEPNFAHYSNEIYQFLKGCDLAGFNSIRFDIPILVEELIRANVEFDFTQIRMIDSQVIYHKKEPRNLSAALQFYCNKELKNAHSAMDDTIATYEVFKAQIEKYDDLESDMDFLNKYSNRYNNLDFAGKIRIDNDDDAIFAFGKYTGQKVVEVFRKDKGYYSWIMKGDFPEYTKKIFTKLQLSLINSK
ncbi:MAG: 3'-5' exonuclease [Flavobacteriales bacterium]|nr:MAG: 3'-5' exonuclease [Flavobacteriales bacterium]CAI8342793.1 MAG: DNA polymerase III subunit epsilon [Flavobacteriales bacterium]|tara:strand:- start:1751 stop:2521 length:771 start_codon:yes stop_codon:yes gene_type:complete